MASSLKTHASGRSPYDSVDTGVAASVLQMLMVTPSYFGEDLLVDEYVSIFAISLAVAVLVFLFVVPNAGDLTALVLGAAAVSTIVVFWAGIALPLAAAAVVVGLRERAPGTRAGPGTAGAALGALAAVALAAAVIGDAMVDQDPSRGWPARPAVSGD